MTLQDPFLDLRLRIVDWCNGLPGHEQAPTAWAWSQILESEAEQLIAGGAWVPTAPDKPTVLRRRHPEKWSRIRGHADVRLAIIIADQAVATLIRAQLIETQPTAP
jgi:hypothetical protein